MMRWSVEHGMSIRRAGSGPELVWLHGLGESSTGFEPAVARLPGFSHVLIDMPGYGRSPWPEQPLGLEGLADLLVEFLRNQPHAAVIGHSMGGVLATMLAERGAAKVIVNVDGNITRADCNFSGQVSQWTEAEFADHGFAEMRARIYARGQTRMPFRGYFAAMTQASPRMFYRNALDLVAVATEEKAAPRLAALKDRALYLAGVPEGVCEASRALLDRHSVPWMALQPAGHWAHLDQTGAFVAAVRDFLRR